MKRRNMILIAIIAAYLIFLWDCKITYSNKKSTNKIEYLGLLWVGLDYWTIWKYQSTDKPKKWISYTKSEYCGNDLGVSEGWLPQNLIRRTND